LRFSTWASSAAERHEFMKRSLLALLLVLAVCFLLLGCEEDEEEQLTAQDWINRGLDYLARSDGASAYLAFSEAINIEHGNLDAKYGQVLADTLQLHETFLLLGGVLGDLTGSSSEMTPEQSSAFCGVLLDCGMLDELGATYEQCIEQAPMGLDDESVGCVLSSDGDCGEATLCLIDYAPPPAEACELACGKFQECDLLSVVGWSVDECIDQCPNLYSAGELTCYLGGGTCSESDQRCFTRLGVAIQDLLDTFLQDVANEMVLRSEDLIEFPEWTMQIPSYSFTLLDLFFQPNLDGENDLGEVYLNYSIANMVQAAFNLLFALDLDFNMTTVMNVVLGLQTDEALDISDTQSIQDLLVGAAEAIGWLLEDPMFPTFLSLREEEGVQLVQDASMNVGVLFGSLVEMIDWIDSETDDQSDDAVRYVDLNEDGIWDEDELLMIPGVGTFEKELVFAMREIFLYLEVNFADGVPVPLSSLEPLVIYFEQEWITFIFDILYLLDLSEIDLSEPLRNPDPEGLRPLLKSVQQTLLVVSDLLGQV
jgi:hypothetical protein